MLQILACPLDPERPPLREHGQYLVCTVCGYGFPVRDGIPDLLPESGVAPEQIAEEMRHAR